MKLTPLVLGLLFSTTTLAQTPEQFIEVYKKFKLGSYAEVAQTLEQMKENKKTDGTRYYLLGISYSRLQQYDKAAFYLSKAILNKNETEDVYYELGQSLYASNELEKARKAFFKASKSNFKKETSFYYIAHISQVLEEYKIAKSFYVKVLKEKTSSDELKQISRFQLAEVLLEMARDKKDARRLVKSYILPQMNKVVKMNEESQVAKDAAKRVKEIQREFGLDPDLMINGKRLSKKRFRLSATQTFEYDNNITLTTDSPDVQDTQKDSFIFETDIKTSYLFDFKKRYTVKPSLSLNKVKHQDRDNSEVYSNDSFQYSIDVKNTFEHKLFNAPASALFEVDYDYKKRDVNSEQTLVFNNKTWTYTFGEKFKFFSLGNTTVKYKRKTFRSYKDTLHFNTNTISVDQVMVFKSGHLGIFLWQYDMNDNFNDTTNSTNTNLFRIDYIIPNFMFKTSLNLAFSATLTSYDDETKSEQRGQEKLLNPSIKLTRKINPHFSIDFGYSYSKQTSDDADQEYTKHSTTTDITYNY